MPYTLVAGVAGVAGLIALLLLGRWFVRANPALLAYRLQRIVGYALVTLAFMSLMAGRVVPAGILGAAGVALLRWQGFAAAAGGGPAPQGSTSQVDTEWLAMTLDHASGGLDGTVRKGRHAGRRLGELTREQVIEVLQDCQGQDAQSVTLLETYLDRIHGMEWRNAAPGQDESASGAAPPSGSSGMTREEALSVLGLKPGASDTEIKDAHRRLMLKLHPDHGGSDYLAAKLNQAKDFLLGN